MIVEYTPQVELYGIRHRMGTATLILPLGHGAYPLPANDKVQVQVWDVYEAEEKGEKVKPPWLVQHEDALRLLGGNYAEALAGEDAGAWGTLVLLRGPVYELWKMFYLFANSLDPEQDPADYTPGGDDDTFDYYPSGFECATEWADDLDAIDEQFAHAVGLASGEWEAHIRARAVGSARRRFSARHRIVGIVNNLRVFKGPFEEWEFEDYAAPYLSQFGA